ncbi:MAG: bifunctional folylpolyglutamate synthase/dihydrofolate synthase [Candidatus Eremiobacteraeota bacterium]|nr:bifunctional folylpolyglutamate synthase/dihydrofolate synthase [Candidatus Eremiobacteraeota bacterium]MBC5802009.1 bifunctional folylpolyglutamate synthase/dihydrofolate synthase [Candidatus Eremiobacteraeota bacterium]MBC5820399.1 bifunctional folylpolyglutamate synthase/dihydrofolate synthase [Candidatus Eremiobacteraeota bacterium]
MTYRDAEQYLLGTINETVSRRHPQRLERMAAFLQRLGNPHRAYPTIHVGGTSGKGSTATMIATVLSASGQRVGLHTKPHLSSMTERARIDGVAISQERFAELLEAMLPPIEATAREEGRPSYYETLLALAFLDFANERVDVAVIEVGVGGTLDGTNLLAPEISVITNVGLDHTDILGNTIEEIAHDKAGIAKAGVTLVSAATGTARAVIAQACAQAGAPFVGMSDVATIEACPSEPYAQRCIVRTSERAYELALPVLGRFQQRNAATAIVALERLPAALRPTDDAIERGMSHLVIAGRMEFFPSFPSIVFDIAHNPDKAASLASALAETFPQRRLTFVIAIAATKDVDGILRPFLALPASFTFTSFETPGRTAERPQRLANVAARAGVAARVIGEPLEALAVARRQAEPSTIVVVTGSTFLVGVLRDWWLAHVAETRRP